MSDSPKINMDEVSVGVRPEEIDSILSLRNTFDYFDVLGKYVSSYLELGWVVKLVIPNLDITLDLDFEQLRDVWNQGLTDLAVKGIHACLMVYTGSASNLMVLEVRGKNAEKALILGRDWRARCVVQAGDEREQHFFTWPQAWKLPSHSALKTLDIQVFGEGGMVTLPPSLTPGAVDSIRWLAPPWENPPSPPTPRLLEVLREHLPAADLGNQQSEPDIPAWEEIFKHIASQARLMQTLLAPMASSEDYYRTLLQEARASGLQDRRLLLGLLWHAPLGRARQEPQGQQWLKDLIRESDDQSVNTQVQEQLAGLIKELSRTLATLNQERDNPLPETSKHSYSSPPRPDNFRLGDKSWQPLPQNHRPTPDQSLVDIQSVCPQPVPTPVKPTPYFSPPMIHPQVEIPVNRKQYEAMIYELGRLGALQKINKRYVREADSLKAKIEAKRQEEIDHLRQLVREKKNKGWW